MTVLNLFFMSKEEERQINFFFNLILLDTLVRFLFFVFKKFNPLCVHRAPQ